MKKSPSVPPMAIAELHSPVEAKAAITKPDNRVFPLHTCEACGLQRSPAALLFVPQPLQARPFPKKPAERRAMVRANQLRRRLIADLTRLESHWYRRIGAYRRLERHVNQLRDYLRTLGYETRSLPPAADTFRLPDASKYAWRPQWADAVTFNLGQLFAVNPHGETQPVPELQPVPAPKPAPDETVLAPGV